MRPGSLAAPQQRAVGSRRQVGWIRPPPHGRGALAGLRYLFYLVAMYGIPAYVFTVWAWYLYTQWVEEIVAHEWATAAPKATAARAETMSSALYQPWVASRWRGWIGV